MICLVGDLPISLVDIKYINNLSPPSTLFQLGELGKGAGKGGGGGGTIREAGGAMGKKQAAEEEMYFKYAFLCIKVHKCGQIFSSTYYTLMPTFYLITFSFFVVVLSLTLLILPCPSFSHFCHTPPSTVH